MEVTFKDRSGTFIHPTDYGTQTLGELIHQEYQDSPLYLAYMLAYVEEMDIIFEEISKVYWSRSLEYATGEALDFIGRILKQKRQVILPVIYFGFDSELGPNPQPIAGFADEAVPAVGGIFFSENPGELGGPAPLDDVTYRRLLSARAHVMQADTQSIDDAYQVVHLLLNRVPAVLTILDIGFRNVEMTLVNTSITATEKSLLYYARDLYVPAGTSINLNFI